MVKKNSFPEFTRQTMSKVTPEGYERNRASVTPPLWQKVKRSEKASAI